MTLFIWHQTAFITVSSVGLLAGRVPGLLTAPTDGVWVAERLAWLPMFAIVLSGLCLVFRRAERALGAVSTSRPTAAAHGSSPLTKPGCSAIARR
jgi:hypothetical protein